ncbi:hypothetical protein F511_17121 [Dorcoceras hygrometricum]|uniref:Uncharacterized protein n=1 Tax=Dorcoceras hygrometricum TaxID=472368 RepID=A0A2Z7CMV9_9LAMI|nr:hypothetical protein F511_17121 [Dorcoceras hygrometricum]
MDEKKVAQPRLSQGSRCAIVCDELRLGCPLACDGRGVCTLSGSRGLVERDRLDLGVVQPTGLRPWAAGAGRPKGEVGVVAWWCRRLG